MVIQVDGKFVADIEIPDGAEPQLVFVPGKLINILTRAPQGTYRMLCLDGFKTLDEFVDALKRLRPDWVRKPKESTNLDCVGGDSCKASTETIKPE